MPRRRDREDAGCEDLEAVVEIARSSGRIQSTNTISDSTSHPGALYCGRHRAVFMAELAVAQPTPCRAAPHHGRR
ncbi:MAG: hypothetical protein L0K86_23200, partial [Actinomycetia bacterium]|nr:hypothetical protein [Actinomycetes bacterium]